MAAFLSPKGARHFLINMVQPGPLGRSIDDLELLWEIIRCPDPADFEIARIEWSAPSGRSLGQLRIAWTDGFEEYVAGAETRGQLAALAARLEHTGARVEKTARRAFKMSTQEYAAALGAKRVMVEEIECFFTNHDVLLVPVS